MKKNVTRYFLLMSATFMMSGMILADDTTSTTTQTTSTCTAQTELRGEGKSNPALSPCEELMIISALNKGRSYEDVEQPKRTMDSKVTCVSKGGYTLDYDYCLKIRNLYNAVLVAEQGMFAQQKIRITENNNKQNAEVAKAQQEGDLQNAALKATKERAEQNSQLYKEQAYTYSTAVTALSSGLAGWPTKGSKTIRKLCGSSSKSSSKETKSEDSKESSNNKADSESQATSGYFQKSVEVSKSINFTNYNDPSDCEKLVSSRKGSIFSNDDARSQFWVLNGQLLQKAAEARRMAGISDTVADKLDKAPQMDDEETVALDPCVVDPSRAECKTTGPRKPTAPTIAGGAMDFGSMGGSQAFDFGSGAGADLSDAGTGSSVPGPETVASVASPFEKEAKEATGILNPASAASISAGSQNSPAGGGGAGGGGGGGGAGLDDDLQGADQGGNKEPEITSTKISTKSASGGGAGFQAVKKIKEDKDPYSSIFGAKDAAGGIEEDRSIASDIDGAASELFQKISKRYGQAQQDKRIEGQKLE